MTIPRIIAVVGGSSGSTAIDHAQALGKKIVEENILLTGGDGSDPDTVKDAAVIGAGKKRIISILKDGGGIDGSSVRSGKKHGRNVLNAVACDAMIALAGEKGTLSEIAFAQMLQRPVILFGGAESTLETALGAADFETIKNQSEALAMALGLECSVKSIEAAARRALAEGFRTSNVDEAVAHAAKAELRAYFPPIEGVDPEKYRELLASYGRR